MSSPYFDPLDKVTVSQRRLPHWDQAGKLYFITFRTADSLPSAVLEEWREERNTWLRRHGIEPIGEDWRSTLEQRPYVVRREFHATFTERFHSLLDDGHGECLLRRPELARIVADSFLHFDGTRYALGDFVIMPNHVHLLVRLFGEKALVRQCRSWKKYTATEINRALGRSGHLWQAEGYDHLVRDPEEEAHFQDYIEANPKKAGLREGEYYYRKA